MLIDSHCHLDFADFDAERDEIIARAGRAGIAGMLTICTKVTQFDRVRAIAESHPQIWCSLGIHPHEAESEPDVDRDRLVELSAHPRVVGIGETGLDFFYDHSPRERQEQVFRTHCQAARETGLPLIVHTRDADADMARILTEESGGGRLTGVIHCFSSGAQLAEKALSLGFYISLSGIVTFKKAEELRDVARAVPMDRLLVETDAPYLAPIPHRGKRNEPAYVAHTAKLVADLKGVSSEEFARATTDNFFKLFAKASLPPAAQQVTAETAAQ